MWNPRDAAGVSGRAPAAAWATVGTGLAPPAPSPTREAAAEVPGAWPFFIDRSSERARHPPSLPVTCRLKFKGPRGHFPEIGSWQPVRRLQLGHEPCSVG